MSITLFYFHVRAWVACSRCSALSTWCGADPRESHCQMGLAEARSSDCRPQFEKRPGVKKYFVFNVHIHVSGQYSVFAPSHLQIPINDVSNIKVIGVITKWVYHGLGHIKPA
jgi:hypothetical protein